MKLIYVFRGKSAPTLILASGFVPRTMYMVYTAISEYEQDSKWSLSMFEKKYSFVK
jgi:hypothetical protein